MLRFEKYALFSVLVFSITVFVSEIDWFVQQKLGCLWIIQQAALRLSNVLIWDFPAASYSSRLLQAVYNTRCVTSRVMKVLSESHSKDVVFVYWGSGLILLSHHLVSWFMSLPQ